MENHDEPDFTDLIKATGHFWGLYWPEGLFPVPAEPVEPSESTMAQDSD